MALDSLHDDFDPVIDRILCAGDKSLDEIQQILMSADAGLLAKRTAGITQDLAMMTRLW